MTKDEFELRGKLATLSCWHRLTQEEEEDLLRFVAAQRTWEGLTDEDCTGMSAGDKVVAMWAEAKLKEKNNG